MSKNFEQEYIEYLNAKAPDLWDRIEVGINARASKNNKRDSVQDPISVTVNQTEINHQKINKKINKNKNRRYVRLWGSIAACFAALVLTVPVMHMLGGKKSNYVAMDAEKATPENYEIANTEDYTTAACDEVQMDNNTEMAEDTEQTELIEQTEVLGVEGDSIHTTDEDQSKQMDNAATEDMASAAQVELNQNDTGEIDKSRDTQSFNESVNVSDTVNQELFTSVKVEIKDITKSKTGSNVYEATVIESTYDNLKAETMITILETDHTMPALEKGKTYVMNLQKMKTDEIETIFSLLEITE